MSNERPESEPVAHESLSADFSEKSAFKQFVGSMFGFDFFISYAWADVLGMIHEHQNPNATIRWDRAAVYDSFTGPPNFWSRDQIDSLILQRFTVENLPHYKDKPIDPKSIMQSTFPESLTLDGTVLQQGTSLSEGDKEFARKLYPK